ncbi:hypothetical protein [Roseovarius sp. PS-C2]|uniref:hypothetical protein n=1 Tax=Roseovarius sp. PS-C2 TaxID=2820814 RepID=UPI001C0E26BF|nr:hypothetical protein [Roseovarius sp. PS-C2]MBU3259068.1 hypothetical protein [Roseovarius sp. PS-C2]MDW3117420.1 hypothetical protein [Roseovarius pacificus]
MKEKQPGKKPDKKAADREDRLKAALKANLARRKAQQRGRGPDNSASPSEDKD